MGSDAAYRITTSTGSPPKRAHLPAPGQDGAVLCRRLAASNTRPCPEVLRQTLGLDLCGECLRHPPVEAFGTITTSDVRALTKNQREALRLAVAEGYYAWPRETTAAEVADRMGIAQPTFSRHLRAAERKLFAALLGETTH